jgi:hypothetical protein
MNRRLEKTVELLRANGLAVGFGVVLVVAAVFAVRWIAKNREAPPHRKVMQFTVVQVQPTPQPKPPPPPPPPPTTQPKIEEPDSTRVEIKATDIPPPEAPPPQSAPAAGPLALAAEGDGPGDAFNLAGNPGGRGLLSGGGVGDGSGARAGLGGEYDPMARYGWYYGKVASRLQEAFQRTSCSRARRSRWRCASGRTGRVNRLELVRSTGDSHDAAIRRTRSACGSRRPRPRRPMPMILRITIRRPQ